ncbi:MAG TPA: serine/threonine-protein kinase, partial [Thermomicrobiales bacterium]|nr:serine/threonine-protein kinase [Thermomicrobiales bacterium]
MPSANLIGQIIGSYRIDALLGSGGMGHVYRATHVQLRRPVAIKVLDSDAATDPTFQARFLREARAAASLSHPNIVHVYDFGEQDGRPFLAMELVPDGSIGELQRSGPLDLVVGLDLVRQAAQGLAAAHEREMVHRDIKPDNLLLAARTPAAPELAPYTVKIADFGLARLADSGPLTQAGVAIGTPAYMSPEQCQGLQVDPRTDIYSLGIVLYEIATGSRPFNVRSLSDAVYQHVHVAPPPPRQVAPDLSADVEQIINRCLAKQPADRYQRAGALVASLDTAIAREVDRRRTGVLPDIAAGAAPAAGLGMALSAGAGGQSASVLPAAAGAGGLAGAPGAGLPGAPVAGGIPGAPAGPGLGGMQSAPAAAGPGAGGMPGLHGTGSVASGPGAGGMPGVHGSGSIASGPGAGGIPGGHGANLAAQGPGAGGFGGSPPPAVGRVNLPANDPGGITSPAMTGSGTAGNAGLPPASIHSVIGSVPALPPLDQPAHAGRASIGSVIAKVPLAILAVAAVALIAVGAYLTGINPIGGGDDDGNDPPLAVVADASATSTATQAALAAVGTGTSTPTTVEINGPAATATATTAPANATAPPRQIVPTGATA